MIRRPDLKNSLLFSLFSGNLTVRAPNRHERFALQDDERSERIPVVLSRHMQAVMAGLVPAASMVRARSQISEVAGTSPAMTSPAMTRGEVVQYDGKPSQFLCPHENIPCPGAVEFPAPG